jgi:hypothetical protein
LQLLGVIDLEDERRVSGERCKPQRAAIESGTEQDQMA